MPDAVLDIETQDLKSGVERIDGDRGLHLDHEVRDIIVTFDGSTLDMDTSAQIAVVHEPVLEGYVRTEKPESGFQTIRVIAHLPRILDRYLQGIVDTSLHKERFLLRLHDIGILAELFCHIRHRIHYEEIGMESMSENHH